jgi:hypothetical protein
VPVQPTTRATVGRHPSRIPLFCPTKSFRRGIRSIHLVAYPSVTSIFLLLFLSVARQEISPDWEQFERQVRSKTRKGLDRSNVHRANKELPHPSRTPSERNRLAVDPGASASQTQSVRQKRHGSDPKTAAPFDLGSAPTCFRLVATSLSPRWAPKQRVPASFDPLFFPTAAVLRRPPADKLVRSEIRARPAVVPRHPRQKPSRTR